MHYGTRSDVAEAANHDIYEDKVLAFHRTNINRRPLHANLPAKLPLSFTADGRVYKLTSYLHYDVTNGAEQGSKEGSRYKLRKVNAMVSTFKTFLRFGRIGKSFAVVIGYTLRFG